MYKFLAAFAVVAFAGHVPPHRANDGRVFLAIGPTRERVEGALKGCAVEHFASLGPLGHAQTVQFALGPDHVGRAHCVGRALGAEGRVEPQHRWIG